MKICAEGSEVVLRLTIEEARKAAVAGPSGLARRALTGDPQWVMGLVKAADQAQAAIDLASGAREYLRAERFDRRVEEQRLDAALLAFEEERAQARRDYGFGIGSPALGAEGSWDDRLALRDAPGYTPSPADRAVSAALEAQRDREVEFRREYQCDPYVPCLCGVPANDPRATWLSAHAVDCAYRVARTAQVESRVRDRLTTEQSPADAAQERADRMFPDREGRVEGVDR